jgi:ribosome-associated protein
LNYTEKQLKETILEAIVDRKGKEIFDFDLSSFEHVICQNFIICHGDSNTQVSAIADNIITSVKDTLSENVYHKEGLENCHWVLLDFGSITVHIFQQEYREYYKLEELWADAKIHKLQQD